MLRSIPQSQARRLLFSSCHRFVYKSLEYSKLQTSTHIYNASFASLSSLSIKATLVQLCTASSLPMELLLLLWIQVKLLSKETGCKTT